MFQNRDLLIATMHKKEVVLAPLFEQKLGVKAFVPKNYDTDSFGTFTGEVERKENTLNTVRQKCLQALKFYNYDLGIASEGSFGPHPIIPFLPANEEIIIFIDLKNDLEIIGRKIEIETNFSSREVESYKELEEFAKNSKFPSHGLILKCSDDKKSPILKGINQWKLLKSSFVDLKSFGSKILVETDMRAMHNPTRMNTIKKAGEALVEKINSKCPSCFIPGFGITSASPGLPCEFCGSPTKSIKSYTYHCHKCSYETIEEFPKGKFTEDPMYCDYCNP